jgi:cytochrome c-type biogenesis protein CcmH
MMNRRLIFFLLAFTLTFAWAMPPVVTYAQEPEITVNDVAQDLYCPLCSGLTVDVCELQVCSDMREVIAEKIAAGESEEQIRTYFIEQYGQKVVAAPATSGFDLTAWILPFAGIGLALVGLLLWLRNRPTPQPQLIPIAPDSAPQDPYAAQLDRELRRLEE